MLVTESRDVAAPPMLHERQKTGHDVKERTFAFKKIWRQSPRLFIKLRGIYGFQTDVWRLDAWILVDGMNSSIVDHRRENTSIEQ